MTVNIHLLTPSATQLVHLTNMDLLVVSPVARNVNHSFILRTETVRSPMVRVCWAVSLDGKGRNVTKSVHQELMEMAVSRPV